MSNVEKIKAFMADPNRSMVNSEKQEILETYLSLSPEEGQELAQHALKFEGYRGIEALRNLAVLVPNSLTDKLYETLITRSHYPIQAVIFRQAGPSIRDMLIAILEDSRIVPLPQKINPRFQKYIIAALAWINDEVVRARFKEWQENPPKWRTAINTPVSDWSYYAGWELNADGSSRSLIFEEFYSMAWEGMAEEYLIPRSAEERCDWCMNPLRRFVDLNLQNNAFNFLELDGKRLYLRGCVHCWAGTLFLEFDTAGNCKHSNYNKPRWEKFRQEAEANLQISTISDPNIEMVITHHYKSYLISLTTLFNTWVGLGGYPEVMTPLVDGFEFYPKCPKCLLAMKSLAVFPDEPPDMAGAFVVYLCVKCQLAAIDYYEH